jgi:hypothetical protein
MDPATQLKGDASDWYSLILSTLKMEATPSSETSVLRRPTLYKTPEGAILRSHRRETPKSYIALIGWTLCQRRNVSSVRYE